MVRAVCCRRFSREKPRTGHLAERPLAREKVLGRAKSGSLFEVRLFSEKVGNQAVRA